MSQEFKRTRLIDIAKQVGVSKAAVAKVLSCKNNSNIRVSKETAEKIVSLARKLNYQPNISARTLAGKSSRIIGVLIDSQAPMVLLNLISEIDKEASRNNYRLMMGEAHDNVDSFYESYLSLKQYGADGIILISHDYPDERDKFRKLFQGAPNLVFVDKPCFDNASYVDVERENGIIEAITHLRNSGRSRIGMFIGISKHGSIQRRLTGYRHGLAINNLPVHEEYIFNNIKSRSVRDNAEIMIDEYILKYNLDSVLAVNDVWAGTLISALVHRGLKVPDDIAVIGNDNEVFGDFFLPSITTIDENSSLQAGAAVSILLDILESPDRTFCRQLTVKTKLVVRDSA